MLASTSHSGGCRRSLLLPGHAIPGRATPGKSQLACALPRGGGNPLGVEPDKVAFWEASAQDTEWTRAHYSILLSISSIFSRNSSDKYFSAEPVTRPRKI